MHYFNKKLKDTYSFKENADRKICIHEMAVDNYQCIINLVLYYQMETRWSIRLLLLSAFKTLSYLDPTATDVMLTSVLPMELVKSYNCIYRFTIVFIYVFID